MLRNSRQKGSHIPHVRFTKDRMKMLLNSFYKKINIIKWKRAN